MPALLLPALLLLAAPLHAAETFEGYTYYIGDPHVHTGVSGDGCSSDLTEDPPVGCGALSEVLDASLENGLDWVALTDHTNGYATATESDWSRELTMVLDHDDDATGLVVIPAAELGLERSEGTLGHRNVFFFGSDKDLITLSIDDTRPMGDASFLVGSCDDLWTWMDRLAATFGPVLLIPHHPYGVLPTPVDFSCHSDTYESSVEVYSSWGTGLGDWTGYDIPSTGTVSTGAAHYAMDPDGLAISFGFVGGTDSHYTTPGDLCSKLSYRGHHVSSGGLTMLVIPEGDPWGRRAIYQALVDHRTAAISGPPVPFVVEYSSEGHLLARLGQTVELDVDSALDVEIRVPSAWVSSVQGVYLTFMDEHWELDSLVDGVWTTSFDALSIPPWLYPSLLIDGEIASGSSYCEDGNDTTDEWVWGSPSWMNVSVRDADHDGYRNDEGDCSDLDPTVHPGVKEIIGDGVDQDCDGIEECYLDIDHDGYRTDSTVVSYDSDCSGDGEADASLPANDCDDRTPQVNPGATEVCDGVDNDCDGVVDGAEASDALMWYPDTDGDGFLDKERGVSDCSKPDGYYALSDAWDCDDADSSVYPGALEIAGDGMDQDCDGEDPAPSDTGPELMDSGLPSPQNRPCGGCSTTKNATGLGALVLLLGLIIAGRRQAPAI